MAKKKNIPDTKTETPAETAAPGSVAALTSPGGFMLPGSSFDDLEGETFAGLNLLKLKPGEAAGPLVLKEILRDQKLGENKKMKAVDVYIALQGKVEIRMPVAASFISKAEAGSLSVGDTFFVKREEDYIAKKFGKANCAAYVLKITARAK